MDRIKLGSETAKGGFKNEKDIVNIFNDWKNNSVAQRWLQEMGYTIDKIKSVQAIQIPTRIKRSDLQLYNLTEAEYETHTRFKKADAQIRLQISLLNITKIENISIKKANSNSDFNQIDKRPVDTYQEMWNFDNEIAEWLKLFTGRNIPNQSDSIIDKNALQDPDKRIYITEMPKRIQKRIIDFFTKNKILIVSDIIKGRGGLAANWLLVTRLDKDTDTVTWKLVDINIAMNFFGQGEIKISPRGSLSIGRITMQRKGGTPDPQSLQFKFSPCAIFDYNSNSLCETVEAE